MPRTRWTAGVRSRRVRASEPGVTYACWRFVGGVSLGVGLVFSVVVVVTVTVTVILTVVSSLVKATKHRKSLRQMTMAGHCEGRDSAGGNRQRGTGVCSTCDYPAEDGRPCVRVYSSQWACSGVEDGGEMCIIGAGEQRDGLVQYPSAIGRKNVDVQSAEARP